MPASTIDGQEEAAAATTKDRKEAAATRDGEQTLVGLEEGALGEAGRPGKGDGGWAVRGLGGGRAREGRGVTTELAGVLP